MNQTPALPYGLKQVLPPSQVSDHKLQVFQNAPLKTSSFQKARDEAAKKAEIEAAQTALIIDGIRHDHGVEEADATHRPIKRSRRDYEIPIHHELLFFNIPHEVTQSDLLKLFARHNPISISLNHPEGIIRFSSFKDAEDAKGRHGQYLGYGAYLSLSRTAEFWAEKKGRDLSRIGPAIHRRATHEINITVPSNLPQLRRIHTTIQRILTHGAEYEFILRKTKWDDEGYGFLWNGGGSQYFRYALYCAYQGTKIQGDQYIYSHPTIWIAPKMRDIDSDDEMEAEEERVLRHGDRRRIWHYLRTIDGSKKSIARITWCCVVHAAAANEVVEIIAGSFSTEDWKVAVYRLYAVSDILYNATIPTPNAWRYLAAFEDQLQGIIDKLFTLSETFESRIRKENFRRLVMIVLDTWRQYYAKETMRRLYSAFGIVEEVEEVVEEEVEVDETVPTVPVIADKIEVPEILQPAEEPGRMPTTKMKISFGKKTEKPALVEEVKVALPEEPKMVTPTEMKAKKRRSAADFM